VGGGVWGVCSPRETKSTTFAEHDRGSRKKVSSLGSKTASHGGQKRDNAKEKTRTLNGEKPGRTVLDDQADSAGRAIKNPKNKKHKKKKTNTKKQKHTKTQNNQKKKNNKKHNTNQN